SDDEVVRIGRDDVVGLPGTGGRLLALSQRVLEPSHAGGDEVEVAVAVDVDGLRILVALLGRRVDRMLGPGRGLVPVQALTVGPGGDVGVAVPVEVADGLGLVAVERMLGLDDDAVETDAPGNIARLVSRIRMACAGPPDARGCDDRHARTHPAESARE